MTEEDQGIPIRDEIINQLNRIIGCERFQANENPARFLFVVVNKALDGEPIKQSVIGHELFPEKYLKGDISDVRVTARNLRRVLAEYYEQEGREDLVIISFPPPPENTSTKLPAGTAYKPLFKYNPRSSAWKDYSQGALYLQQLTEVGLRNALGSFDAVIKTAPHHSAAHAGTAEAYCIFAMFDRHAKPLLILAHEAALRAARSDPASWRGHAALGLVYSCLWEWDKAAASFATALERDSLATQNCAWYCYYLLAVGKPDDALQFAKRRADARPENFNIRLIYALVLYVTRQYEMADQMLVPLLRLQLYQLDWRVLFLKVLVGLRHSGWPDLSALNDSLMNAIKSHPFHRWKNLALGVSVLVHQNRGVFLESVMDAGPLIKSFADMAMNDFDQLRKSNEPLPLALAHIGLVQPEMAITELERCCEDRHPLMAWLHICPLFDQLREERKFQELIVKTNLPKTTGSG